LRKTNPAVREDVSAVAVAVDRVMVESVTVPVPSRALYLMPWFALSTYATS